MPNYTTQDIRNIAFVGEGASGKTTLIEALLHQTGMIQNLGSIEKKNTVCDFDLEEKEHQHSLNSAIVSCDHAGHHINLIDTPGMIEFSGHALSVLTAVETVAVVITAQHGINMVARRIMERAATRKLCRIIIVNKIDAEEVDLEQLLGQIQELFGKECLPINLPSRGRSNVVDVFNKADGDVDFGSVTDAHTAIVDQVVEMDENLMETYLEQGKVSLDQLHTPFTNALKDGHLVPICFVSALQGVGVQELLEVFSHMMPNPTEGNAQEFYRRQGEDSEEVDVTPDASKTIIAHVFKVTADPFIGKLGVFRIFQGTVKKDSQLHLGDERKTFKVGHLLRLQGKEHTEVDMGIPGDICAVAKIDEIRFDAVLRDNIDNGDVRLKPMDFPQPMNGFAIEAKSRGDEQKIGKALVSMEAEDPCFTIERNITTSETVIYGLGDMHLRVILKKMKNRYNVEVNTHPPKIAYKETILGNAEGHHRHRKQSGGAGQFGEVFLRISPQERGEGFEFTNDTFGGSIPRQFIPAVEKGVRLVMEQGAIAGYPIQDIKVSVHDGKHHPVDSKEVAFVTAAKKALIDAIEKAKPVILEPVVQMDIIVPEGNMGDIAGDLSSKRGRLQGSDTLPGGMLHISAQAPLAELGQYQSQLKAVTAGQGSYTMQLSHYDVVPPNIQQQIIDQYKPKAEDD
tara:strand:+ start:6868 stop:8913 length:2046 start_codon:yes stop_codon:yes gene_type:complete